MTNIPGPPESMTAEELVAALCERPAPSRVVPFPAKHIDRDGGQLPKAIKANVRIMMVDPFDISRAKVKAVGHVKKLLTTKGGREPTAADLDSTYAQELRNDWLTAEMVSLCTWSENPANSDPDKPVYERIFMGGAEQVMDPKKGGLFSDEIAVLFTNYMTMELELGPREQVLLEGNDVTLNLWLERIKRGLWSLSPFSSLAFQDLAELTLLAFRKIDQNLQSGAITLDLPSWNSPSSSEPELA